MSLIPLKPQERTWNTVRIVARTTLPFHTQRGNNGTTLLADDNQSTLFDRPRRTSDILSRRGFSGDPDSARAHAGPSTYHTLLISW